MAKTVADLVIERLIGWGVHTIFGLPGDGVNGLFEALRTHQDALQFIQVRHTIPKDIQDWTADEAESSRENIAQHSGSLFAPAWPLPPPPLLQLAAEVINSGSKVAILVGQGCLHARDEVLALAEKVAGPIIQALLGKAVVPDTSPYTTGGVGLLGTAPSQEALEECDTLIIAGSSFLYLEFYPKPGQARIVQIDIDPTRIGLRSPTDVGLVGDCRDVLQALLPLINHQEDRSFLDTAQERLQQWQELMEERGTRTDMPMKPQVVT